MSYEADKIRCEVLWKLSEEKKYKGKHFSSSYW